MDCVNCPMLPFRVAVVFDILLLHWPLYSIFVDTFPVTKVKKPLEAVLASLPLPLGHTRPYHEHVL